jgi:hypothetical protein
MVPGTPQAAGHRLDKHGELRVLHWNIHSWRDTGGEPNSEGIVDLIREIRPDAVSLVEVDESWGMPSIPRLFQDHLNSLSCGVALVVAM